MDEQQKKQTIENIRKLLDLHEVLFNIYKNFVPIIEQNKEDVIDILISFQPITLRDQWEISITNIIECKDSFESILFYVNKLKEEFVESDRYENLSPQYIKLVASELESNNNMEWYTNFYQEFDSVLQRNANKINEVADRQVLFNGFQYIFGHAVQTAQHVLQRIAQLNTFEHIKGISSNIVIIGANGSGKSSFSRSTKRVLGKNVAIISAQKIFAYTETKSMPIGNSVLNSVHKFQADDKLFRTGNPSSQFNSDLMNIILSLIAEYNSLASEFYDAGAQIETPQRTGSKLERVMEIWSQNISHRFLKYDNKTGNIIVGYDGGSYYSFSNLSDGEKAVFYYISHILLAKNNSFIIVDEPENHLHLSIISKLWDLLESERPDCKFIYLTHNLDFASSRIGAKKLWNKKFIPPAQWDVQALPEDEELPEILLMELLGSRREILFCEGEKSSRDYKLYSILFPDFTIVPVGGHNNVISYTRAFNRSKDMHGNKALGIIDGDYHTSEEIECWAQDSIFCIGVQEVENLLCDELLLDAAKEQFLAADDSVTKAKNKFFSLLKKDIDKQALEYATQRTNNSFKKNMLLKLNSLEGLKSGINSLLESLDVEAWESERKNLLRSIVDTRNYEDGIKYFNYKGLVGLIPLGIEKEYSIKVFALLENSLELVQNFKRKHFSMIPNVVEQNSQSQLDTVGATP